MLIYRNITLMNVIKCVENILRKSKVIEKNKMFKLFRSRNHAIDIASSIATSKDVSIPTKIKNGSAGEVASGMFEEYCSFSTIHGTKYLGDTRRHWLEKTWWILALVTALLGCGHLIRQLYIKWDQSPVIVSFSEKSTPIWQIPFPSVTICPETKANKSLIDFSKIYHAMNETTPPYNITDQERKYMAAVSQICEPHLTDNFEFGENITDSTIIDLLREVAPTFHETMHRCKFRNTLEFCSDHFEEIITDDGLCFTFNMLNAKDLYRDEISKDFLKSDRIVASRWNLETGYEEVGNIEPQIYPHRVFGADARTGLFVLLGLYEQNLEYICRGPVQGFKILLHPPGEIPQVSKQYFRVPLLQEVLVSVKPNMVTTSERLIEYPPDRRQCFFNSERYLRFFKVYTQRNCELECLANYTMKICGCVRFSMPRDDKTPICGASKIACYNQVEDYLLKKQYVEGISADENEHTPIECNCLPECTSIRYDAEISQAPYDWANLFKAYRRPLDEHSGMQHARLAIFFRENNFITFKRSELYGLPDFLASCGGILGLYMGLSALSIVEIIYHISLRVCCNLRKRASHQTRNEITIRPLPGNMVDVAL